MEMPWPTGPPGACPGAADAVEREDADQSRKHVEDVVQTDDPLALRLAHACDTENGRSVDGDSGNADPFLHDLEPDDELGTTAGVEVAGPDAEEHVRVRLVAELGALELAGGDNVVDFCFGVPSVLTGVAT